jgi:hypothetical protein
MEEYEYDHEGALQKFLENGRKPQPTYVELLPPASAAEHADLDRRWKLLMLSRRVSGMQDLLESTADANLAIKEDRLLKRTGAQVGISRHPYGISDCDSEDGIDRVHSIKSCSRLLFKYICN